ncbi:unnamed protein product, partial [marine sediment metagenome]
MDTFANNVREHFSFTDYRCITAWIIDLMFPGFMETI